MTRFFRRGNILLLLLCLLLSVFLTACGFPSGNDTTVTTTGSDLPIDPSYPSITDPLTKEVIPAFTKDAYYTLNNGVPLFTEAEIAEAKGNGGKIESFERYGDFDTLQRCTAAYACVGKDLMPEGERGSIGQVKPTGWHTVKYDCVSGKYLYNRCHLIGWQLTAENANVKNLITGTRFLNIDGMVRFENMVADYVRETGNHVLYRVTPIFLGSDLLAVGVRMEALSLEDDEIRFHVFCYNVQPGIVIRYSDGESRLAGDTEDIAGVTEAGVPDDDPEATFTTAEEKTYVYSKSGDKFHLPTCRFAESISPENRVKFTGSRDALIGKGYSPCKTCNP